MQAADNLAASRAEAVASMATVKGGGGGGGGDAATERLKAESFGGGG